MLILTNYLYLIILKALLITIVSEEICLLLMRERKLKVYLTCLIMNVVTNISMNIILQYVSNYYTSLVIFEILVFVIEMLVYLLVTKKLTKSIIYSLVCNIGSLLVGMLL